MHNWPPVVWATFIRTSIQQVHLLLSVDFAGVTELFLRCLHLPLWSLSAFVHTDDESDCLKNINSVGVGVGDITVLILNFC